MKNTLVFSRSNCVCQYFNLAFALFFSLCSVHSYSQITDDQLWKKASELKPFNFYPLQESFELYLETFDPTSASVEETKAVKRFSRFSSFWRDRVATEDLNTSGLFDNYMNSLLLWEEEPVCVSNDNPTPWSDQGPLSSDLQNMGRVDCAWMDPLNPAVILAGTPNSGIYRTVDGGITWINTTDPLRLPGMGVADIEVDPNNQNIVYAALGNTGLFANGYGPGIIKSIDAGLTWSLLDGFPVDNSIDNGVLGTRVHRLKVDPNYSQRIYAAFQNNIYKSEDSGTTWINTSENYFNVVPGEETTQWFRSIELDPVDTDIVYVSSWNKNGLYGGASIWKSEDNAQTWTRIDQNIGSVLDVNMTKPLNSFGYSSSDWDYGSGTATLTPQIGTLSSVLGLGAVGGSTAPGGQYFINLSATIPAFCQLTIKGWNELMTESQILYTNLPFSNTSEVVQLDITDGYYDCEGYHTKYTFEGQAFTGFTSGSIEITEFEIVNNQGQYFIVDIPEAEHVYASVLGNGPFGPTRYYESIDGGNNWTYITQQVQLDWETVSSNTSGIWRAGFHVSNPQTDKFYTGGDVMGKYDVSISTGVDNITSFQYSTSASFPSSHADVRDFELYQLPGQADILLVCCDGGLTISTDGGDTWENKNGYGMSNHQFFFLGTSEHIPDRYVAGAQDNHTFFKEEDLNWLSQYSGDGGGTAIDPFDPEVAYISANASRRIVTYDMGGYSSSSISQLNARTHRPPIFCAPHQEELVYFGGADRITRVDFSQNPDEKISLLEGAMKGAFRGLAFSRSNPDIAYAVSDGVTWGNGDNLPQKTVWKSTDNGFSWVDVSLNNHGSHWYGAICVAVDPNDANRVYTGHGGLPTNQNDPRRVMVSEDGGSTWTRWDDGLPLLPTNDLEIQDGNGIIYAGTDVGVFYRLLTDPSIANGGEGWQCFNDGLPVCIVSDLDIINCSQELVIASFGRGVWKTSLLPADDIIIDVDTDWDTDRNVYANVVILDDAKLTITANINMADNKGIQVMQGGELVVDGGYITNNCDRSWSGIYVEGDPGGQYSSDNPGKATIKNGAILEHANTALNNFLFEDGEVQWNTTGGYLRVTNSTFINNKRDVQFMAYDNQNGWGTHTNDLSYFYNSNFITDDAYPYGVGAEANFTSWRCNGMRIKGCTFEDSRTGIDRHLKRRGIVLSSSTAKIKEYCWSQNPDGTCALGEPNEFIDLYKGIDSYGSTHPLFLTQVKSNLFERCWAGIYLLTSQRAEIWDNDFEVTPAQSLPGGNYIQWPVGIYLHSKTSAYTIEDNRFYPIPNSTDPESGNAFGIVAVTGQGNIDRLYKNNFKHLTAGVQSIDKNRDYINGDDTGISLQCNEFDRNRVDISIVDGGSTSSFKGLHNFQGFDDNPARNTFNLDMGLRNISNELIPTEYYMNYTYYVPEAATEQPVHSYYDDLHVQSQSDINIDLIGDITAPPGGCPTVQGGGTNGGHKSSRLQAQNDRDAQESLMEQVLDGGDTDALQSDVQLTTNQDAWEKYLLLMSEAGFVTETVLKELANKEDGYTLAMIRNVLVANPHSAKSKEVMEELEQRTSQLPEYMMAQIKAGLAQMSPKEYLQMIRDKHAGEFSYHTKAIYHNLIRDSLPPDSLFELVSILEATGSKEFDYAQVALYDAMGQSPLAAIKLDLMSQNPNLNQAGLDELARYVALRQTMLQWGETAIRQRALDESALDYLVDMAAIDDYAGGIAKAHLAEYGLLDLDYPVIIPAEVEKRLGGKDVLDNMSTVRLDIIPNPASDHITLDYRLESSPSEPTFLRIIDNRGVVRQEQRLTSSEDQLLIQLSLESGSYRCDIIGNGESIVSKQLVISK